MDFIVNIYLRLWKSHKFVGTDKNIRLTRTYEPYGKGVLDIIWCLRDYRNLPKRERVRSLVITKRCNLRAVKDTIRDVEEGELLHALAHFEGKMKGETGHRQVDDFGTEG